MDIEKFDQQLTKNIKDREKRQQDAIGKPGDSAQLVVGPSGTTAPADSGYSTPIYPKNAQSTVKGNWSYAPSDEKLDKLFQGKNMKELAEFEQWVKGIVEDPTQEDNDELDEQEPKMARVPVDAPVSTHTVQKGDTLYSLSKKFGTDVDRLKQMNRQDSDNIQIGQTLNVPQLDMKEEEQLEEAHAGDTCSCCDNKIDEQGKCGCGPECEHCGGQHEIDEVVDIDTGKQALKAERDPMLEAELARILQLTK
jgi:LysM repeat protein